MLSDNSRVNGKSYNQLLGVILLIALIARLSWVLAVPTQPISDFKEYDRLAVGLLSGKGYVNINSQPTAYRAPGYSFFVAGIYSIFGQHDVAIRLTQVMLGVLTCWLTYSIAIELFDRRVALLAAFLTAIFPSLVAWTNILATENLFIPISLGIILSFIKGVKPLAIRWPWLALSGFLAGIAVLVRPAALLLPGILTLSMVLIAGWKNISANWIQWLAKIAMTGVVLYGIVFATILPWTIRNWQVFGRFVLVSTEGGITFLSGHNEQALYDEYSVDGPVFSVLNAEKLDEVGYDKRAYQMAFQFIRNNPVIELRLLAHKLFNYFKDDVSGFTYNDLSAITPLPNWLTYSSKGIAEIFYLLVFFLALASVFTRHYPKDRWYYTLVIFSAVWTIFHLAYYGKDRFRLPLTPVLCMFAAITLLAIWEKGHAWLDEKNRQPVK